jgi:hypothetical protein
MQELQTIKTKYGTFYIEKIGYQEEDERIKIYDSKQRYMDYFNIEHVEDVAEINCISPEEYMADIIHKIKYLNNIEELLDYLGIAWECMSTDWKDVANYLSLENPEKTEKDLLENEWVNVIGDYYVAVYPI